MLCRYFSLIIFSSFVFASVVMAAQEEKKATRVPRDCSQCHTHHETVIRGLLEEVSEMDRTVSLVTYTGQFKTVKYDADTVVTGWEGSIPGLPRDRGIAITVGEKNGVAYAERISVRPSPKGRGKSR